MTRGMWWPIGIGAVLAATVAANIGVMVLAKDDPSFAVERDYYAKALRWDDVQAQARHNQELGWRLTPTLAPFTPGRGAHLTVHLADASGVALDAAEVRVAALHTARAADVLEATLAPRPDGVYDVELPVARAGQWELRFEVTRGAERFTAVARVEAARIEAAHTPAGR